MRFMFLVLQWVQLCILDIPGPRDYDEPREEDPLIRQGVDNTTDTTTRSQTQRELPEEPSGLEWIELQVFGTCIPRLREHRRDGQGDRSQEEL